MKKFIFIATLGALLLADYSNAFAVSADNETSFEHLRDREPNSHDRRFRRCYDEDVVLYCRVDGYLEDFLAYTDCPPTRNGGSCYRVATPGYRQVKMRVKFICRNGRWVWALGRDGWCELRSYRRW